MLLRVGGVYYLVLLVLVSVFSKHVFVHCQITKSVSQMCLCLIRLYFVCISFLSFFQNGGTKDAFGRWSVKLLQH